MNDWLEFIKDVSWFAKPSDAISLTGTQEGYHLSLEACEIFPDLAKLLRLATVTDISLNDKKYRLLAWNSKSGERTGWLCPSQSAASFPELYTDHQTLLTCFSGVVERFNESCETWLINQNDVLTLEAASTENNIVKECGWLFDENKSLQPISPDKYYTIAKEANGNKTVCHRFTGQVLMLAHDHNFDYVTILKGCPEYTLYTINGVVTFRDWVNAIGRQWLSQIHEA